MQPQLTDARLQDWSVVQIAGIESDGTADQEKNVQDWCETEGVPLRGWQTFGQAQMLWAAFPTRALAQGFHGKWNNQANPSNAAQNIGVFPAGPARTALTGANAIGVSTTARTTSHFARAFARTTPAPPLPYSAPAPPSSQISTQAVPSPVVSVSTSPSTTATRAGSTFPQASFGLPYLTPYPVFWSGSPSPYTPYTLTAPAHAPSASGSAIGASSSSAPAYHAAGPPAHSAPLYSSAYTTPSPAPAVAACASPSLVATGFPIPSPAPSSAVFTSPSSAPPSQPAPSWAATAASTPANAASGDPSSVPSTSPEGPGTGSQPRKVVSFAEYRQRDGLSIDEKLDFARKRNELARLELEHEELVAKRPRLSAAAPGSTSDGDSPAPGTSGLAAAARESDAPSMIRDDAPSPASWLSPASTSGAGTSGAGTSGASTSGAGTSGASGAATRSDPALPSGGRRGVRRRPWAPINKHLYYGRRFDGRVERITPKGLNVFRMTSLLPDSTQVDDEMSEDGVRSFVGGFVPPEHHDTVDFVGYGRSPSGGTDVHIAFKSAHGFRMLDASREHRKEMVRGWGSYNRSRAPANAPPPSVPPAVGNLLPAAPHPPHLSASQPSFPLVQPCLPHPQPAVPSAAPSPMPPNPYLVSHPASGLLPHSFGPQHPPVPPLRPQQPPPPDELPPPPPPGPPPPRVPHSQLSPDPHTRPR